MQREHCPSEDSYTLTYRDHITFPGIVTDGRSDDAVPPWPIGVETAQRPVEARHEVFAIAGEANTVRCHNFILSSKEQLMRVRQTKQ